MGDNKKPFGDVEDDNKLDWDKILGKRIEPEEELERIKKEEENKTLEEKALSEILSDKENTEDAEKQNEEVVIKDLSKEKDKDAEVKKNEKKLKKIMKKKKHRKLKIFLRIIFITFLILIIAAVAAFFAILKTDKWNITEEEFLADGGAKIYDKNGNIIVTLTGDEINKKVELSQMGKIPEAFIAIEDERFYEHKGIDVTRTLHAVVKYIFSRGNASFGGSTITQQLVKITMKDNERSGIEGIERKIREWSRSSQLEKMFSKEQILQRYLNRIYLGSADGLEIHGVESACNYYFNKPASEISIAQAAFIAGINHSPSNYNKFTSEGDITERINKRTITVLDKMVELGKITQEEYDTAKAEVEAGLAFEKGNVSNGNSDISYHTAAAINQIANELSDKNDISYSEAREMAISNGYSIYTTVDVDVQNKMKEIFEDNSSDYIVKGSRLSTSTGDDYTGQSAMCIIEPSTGYVVGEYGGLGTDQNTLGINRGTSKRQGGSAFKPLVTIAPGLENKVITPATLFYDVQTNFGNYKVSNDSASYHDVENMRNILTHSCNVPEVKLLSILGTAKSEEFLSKIGINTESYDAGLSMALGTIDVSPLEMAAGYAMLANGGTYITPTFYTKVVDKDGNTILEPRQEKTRVMSEQNAYLETSMLEGPIKSGGTASAYAGYLGSMDVSGKTGTTTDGKDRWFCGYTPYYAAACWYGNDNNNAGFNMSNPASKVWFNTMKIIHKDLEVKKFEEPSGIKSVTICKDTGRKATGKCANTYTEIFADGNIPAECEGHNTVKICKESGKLATDFCTDIEERATGFVIDTEKNANWSPNLKNGNHNLNETCDIHTEAPKLDVPNVVGKTESEAKKELQKAGFKVKVERGEDNTKAKGIVLKQSAKKAPKDSEIAITVNQKEGTNQPTNTTSNTTNDSNTTSNKTNSNTTKTNTTSGENKTSGG